MLHQSKDKRGKRKKCHVLPRTCDGSGPQRGKGMEDVSKQVSSHIQVYQGKGFQSVPPVLQ